jgi:hypothetical protein
MQLFQGQSAKFFTTLQALAVAADRARRQVEDEVEDHEDEKREAMNSLWPPT